MRNRKSPFIPRKPQQPLLFLLDYDGTLTDFKKNPQSSVLPPATRKTLLRLNQKHKVVIVTGRYVKKLRELSGLKNLSVIGTHGFEASHLPKGLRFASPSLQKRYRQEARAIWRAVRGLHRVYPGIHIEEKPYSSTLHYRGTPLSSQKIKALRKEYIRLCRQAITSRLWTFESGKKMVEVMPKGFSKGKSVRILLKLFPNHLVFSAGDDIADVTVFKAIGKKGVKLAVGNRIPRKHYNLRFQSPRQLIAWLRKFV